MLLIREEVGRHAAHSQRELGPLRQIAPYLARRQGLDGHVELPSLLVPEQFKQVFRDWAEGRLDVTAPQVREPGADGQLGRPTLEA